MSESNLVIEKGGLEDVPRIIDFVVQWLNNEGLEKLSFYIETAVDEAVTNVFKHGYAGQGGFISVNCSLTDKNVNIVINDRAKTFDPATVPVPDVVTDLNDRKIGGLGIYIMRKMMDEVEYSFNATEGNQLILRKKIA